MALPAARLRHILREYLEVKLLLDQGFYLEIRASQRLLEANMLQLALVSPFLPSRSRILTFRAGVCTVFFERFVPLHVHEIRRLLMYSYYSVILVRCFSNS